MFEDDLSALPIHRPSPRKNCLLVRLSGCGDRGDRFLVVPWEDQVIRRSVWRYSDYIHLLRRLPSRNGKDQVGSCNGVFRREEGRRERDVAGSRINVVNEVAQNEDDLLFFLERGRIVCHALCGLQVGQKP